MVHLPQDVYLVHQFQVILLGYVCTFHYLCCSYLACTLILYLVDLAVAALP